MKRVILLSPLLALMVSCSTLDQSLKFGAAAGALAGAAAMYAGHEAHGSPTPSQELGTGASIGLAVGLISSYFIHQKVIEDREESSRQTEIYFGDLPPSPFVFPQPKQQKRGH